MANLVLVGGEAITPLEDRFTSVWIENGKVAALADCHDAPADKVLDVTGCYVTPGLVDLQVNGAEACNFWADPEPGDVEALCKRMLQSGVTCFLPTLITDDLDHMSKNISFCWGSGSASKMERCLARDCPVSISRVHVFLRRAGVHPPKFLQPLKTEVLERILNGSVRLITAALELDDQGKALSFIQSKGTAVALGHSNATFEEARSVFDKGVKLMTHTYNALPPLHHRKLGAVGAAMLDDRVFCCVICDGLHVDPEAVRLLLRLKTPRRTIFVTDIAHVGTAGGGLVGSSIYLDEAVRNSVKWGVASFAEAILMSTLNPAMAIGLETRVGRIAPGQAADLIVWDKNTLEIKYVLVDGNIVK